MEIKLNLQLQSILNFIHFIENLELESIVLIVVGLLLTPFMVSAVWSLGITVLCQMFWLGVKAGTILSLVCAAYMTFLKFYNLTTTTTTLGRETKCTLTDIILSVLFQAGLRIPTVIWDRLVKVKYGANMEQPQNGKWNERLLAFLANEKGSGTQQPDFRAGGDSDDHSTASTVENFPRLTEFKFGAAAGAGDFIPQRSNPDEEIIKQILLSKPPTPPVFTASCSTATEGAPTRRRRRGTRAGGAGVRKN